MRAVFVGTSGLAVATASLLLERGHQVVMIEQDEARIATLADRLDCGFLRGDGTKPSILREASPSGGDLLFCLTDDDQVNILASLVGRSVGFPRVVTRIEEADYLHVCTELGLTDTIVPDEAVARQLADITHGVEPLTLTAFMKHEARFYSFFVRAPDLGRPEDLDLPDKTRIVCLYRGEHYLVPEEAGRLRPGDEVLLVTHESQLPSLAARWGAPAAAAGSDLG